MTYEYSATTVRVIDGDTVIFRLEKDFTLDIDFGFHIKDKMTLKKTTEMSFRLLGIDTPEIVGAEKESGLKAKEALIQLLALGPIRLVTYKADKYGRWLAEAFVTTEAGELNVNQELIRLGFAVPYMV